MLNDEELTTRLRAAFHESVPELTYTGPVPRVRRRGGLAATSALAAGAALILAPAVLHHDRARDAGRAPDGQHATAHAQTTHTLDLGGLRLTYATTTAGRGEVMLVVGPHLAPPPDAEKTHLDIPADVWFAAHPHGHDPQVYVRPYSSSMVYGLLAPGWTRRELVHLLEHPQGS